MSMMQLHHLCVKDCQKSANACACLSWQYLGDMLLLTYVRKVITYLFAGYSAIGDICAPQL